MKDYYKVLGIPRSAAPAEIQRAYRKLIKTCHPDVNDSPRSMEWTRELNEAYGVLADALTRASYDAEVELCSDGASPMGAASPGASAGNSRPRSDGFRAGGPEEAFRSGNTPAPEPAATLWCDLCNRVDESLRYSTTWRVFSLGTHTKRVPMTNILCSRCRVRESLAASGISFVCGWWSVRGIIWTLDAFAKNARGGEQPIHENAALLYAVGNLLDQGARLPEAYDAMLAAFVLKPDRPTREALESLKERAGPRDRKTFWQQLGAVELHPFCYHAAAAGAGLLLLLYCLRR